MNYFLCLFLQSYSWWQFKITALICRAGKGLINVFPTATYLFVPNVPMELLDVMFSSHQDEVNKSNGRTMFKK